MEMEVTLESVQALVKQRDEMEETIKVNLELLNGHGVGMDAPLVDAEGYPLSGVDLPAIRAARHSVYCLRNDLKELVLRIDHDLGIVHEGARKDKERAANGDASAGPAYAQADKLEPFARIGRVSSTSPANKAGLLEGDLVLKFGSINQMNFSGIPAIAALVNNSEDRPIQVAVLRSSQRKDMILKPQRWKGQGLLGCFITPLDR